MKSIFRLRRGWLAKIQRMGRLGLLAGFLALLSGCASSGEPQQSAAPTVGGPITVGVPKNF
jgi:hypothetical protein